MSLPLPPGSFSWNPAKSTLDFHKSAHGVVHEQAKAHGDASLLHLKIIGRDVLLVRDYKTAKWVLENGERFSSRQAYSDLMAKYFPEPNIWFEDVGEPDQERHRAALLDFMQQRLEAWSALEGRVRATVRRHRQAWTGRDRLDLYKICKELAHEVLMDLFLGLLSTEEPARYQRAGELGDMMLRGQFSLPLGINVGIWQSPHAKGMQAKRAFEAEILQPQLDAGKCPFLHLDAPNAIRQIDTTSLKTHSLMFASSLVTKSFASVLSTMLLQLSRHPQQDSSSLTDMLRSLDSKERARHLEAIQKENGRLCPAVIGVLRRNKGGEFTLSIEKTGNKVRIPQKWDVWLYFPDIMRDPEVFGANARSFDATRYMQGDTSPPEPFHHGAGPKSCIGKELVTKLISTILDELLFGAQAGSMSLADGEAALDESMKELLGWRGSEPPLADWSGVKQLPIQRPRHPIWVHFDV